VFVSSFVVIGHFSQCSVYYGYAK